MSSFNRVTLLGNLARDPELRYTASGKSVCNIVVAVNEKWKSDDKGKERVDFFRVVVWGNTANAVHDYLIKGSQVLVDGKLQTQTWEKDGKKNYTIQITASNVIFLGKRGQQEQQTPSQQSHIANLDVGDDIPF